MSSPATVGGAASAFVARSSFAAALLMAATVGPEAMLSPKPTRS
jgi:hypothetical protein